MLTHQVFCDVELDDPHCWDTRWYFKGQNAEPRPPPQLFRVCLNPRKWAGLCHTGKCAWRFKQYLSQLNHFVIQQKLTHHCKAILLQERC